jgi:site-specific DNA-methyltransferase (adenine-specific)
VVRTDKGCDGLYGKESHKVFIYDDKGKLRNNEPRYEPPLPNSVIRDTKDYTNNSVLYGNIKRPDCMRKNNESMYNPPLPNSIIEIKSEKRKHATQKPVPLMEWILKYYSREGDVVLDPTMGSGSMGVACINMKRLFIGIEKDENIFDIAFNRLTIEV